MLDPSIVKYVFIAHRYERGLNRVLVSLRVYTSLTELTVDFRVSQFNKCHHI